MLVRQTCITKYMVLQNTYMYIACKLKVLHRVVDLCIFVACLPKNHCQMGEIKPSEPKLLKISQKTWWWTQNFATCSYQSKVRKCRLCVYHTTITLCTWMNNNPQTHPSIAKSEIDWGNVEERCLFLELGCSLGWLCWQVGTRETKVDWLEWVEVLPVAGWCAKVWGCRLEVGGWRYGAASCRLVC